jgi:hypothetical protein
MLFNVDTSSEKERFNFGLTVKGPSQWPNLSARPVAVNKGRKRKGIKWMRF